MFWLLNQTFNYAWSVLSMYSKVILYHVETRGIFLAHFVPNCSPIVNTWRSSHFVRSLAWSSGYFPTCTIHGNPKTCRPIRNFVSFGFDFSDTMLCFWLYDLQCELTITCCLSGLSVLAGGQPTVLQGGANRQRRLQCLPEEGPLPHARWRRCPFITAQ